MNKRGQATVFIIIGIIVVLAVVLGLVFSGNLFSSEELVYPAEVQDVRDYIQECVDNAAKNAVISVGYSGGYFDLPVTSFEDVGLPYYVYDGDNLMPSLTEVEEEIGKYATLFTFTCVNLERFPNYDIQIISIDSVVSIEDEVSVVVEYPMDIFVEDLVFNLYDPYESEVGVDLSNMHDVASSIVEYDLENKKDIDLNYLLDLGMSRIVYVPYNEDTLVYMLEDNTAFNGEETYKFMFASYFPVPEEYANMSIEEYWGLFE